MQIYKRVFILGAGFSKSFCKSMPLMNELTDQVFVAPSKKSEFWELNEFAISQFEKSNKSEEIKNIENLATAIFQNEFSEIMMKNYSMKN